ncbi:hypothetical protein NPIL_488011 [Nephila pilipes]|uniref:Uncharacterized protein n=1 Tax=Nephila pilipes TaxID=299642 RepID=A0A8X6P1W2_NEPPI|nr:hypothetical protein NPIL_488011 [Nephila pilipes]
MEKENDSSEEVRNNKKKSIKNKRNLASPTLANKESKKSKHEANSEVLDNDSESLHSTPSSSGGESENEIGVKEATALPASVHSVDEHQSGSEEKDGFTNVSRKPIFNWSKFKHIGIEGVEREDRLKGIVGIDLGMYFFRFGYVADSKELEKRILLAKCLQTIWWRKLDNGRKKRFLVQEVLDMLFYGEIRYRMRQLLLKNVDGVMIP